MAEPIVNQTESSDATDNSMGNRSVKSAAAEDEEEADYRYVSIVDVNPSSEYGSVSEGLDLEGSADSGNDNTYEGEVLKCSVMIGEAESEGTMKGDQADVEEVIREKLKRSRSGSSDYWIQEEMDDDCIVDFLDKSNDHVSTWEFSILGGEGGSLKHY